MSEIRIEVPTGIDSYDDEMLVKDADHDVLNAIASQYDTGEDWIKMQEAAYSGLDIEIATLGDFDRACEEKAADHE